MQSPGPNLAMRHGSCIAGRIQLYERLSRGLIQPVRSGRQRLVSANAAELDANSASTHTTLNFKTHFQCAYGEQLKLVGNTAELGNWDVSSAPSLSWTSGDSWTGSVELEKADDAEFKLVHLSHGGVVWEPISHRKLQQLNSSSINLDLAWGSEGFQVAADEKHANPSLDHSSSAAEFDLLWHPTQTASTPMTSTPALQKVKDKRSAFDVTLEPEWGVLDLDTPESNAGNDEASRDTSACVAANGEINSADQPALLATSLEAEPRETSAELQSSRQAATLVNPAKTNTTKTKERGLVKRKRKSRTWRGFMQLKQVYLQQSSGITSLVNNAQNLAVRAASAATLATAGLHGQDFVFGAVGMAAGQPFAHGQELACGMAAGATLLPALGYAKQGVLEFNAREALGNARQGLLHFKAHEAVYAAVLGLGETALRAASVCNAAKQKWDHMSHSLKASLKWNADVKKSKEIEMPDMQSLEEELAEYVAGLAREATEYAMQYNPSQEELFEASVACQEMDKEPTRADEFVSNIVPGKLKIAEVSAC